MTLELTNITKRVGAETHLYETSLTLAAEGFNTLLGATGSGKTTLIKVIAGLEKPSSGEIRLNGRDITEVSPQRRRVALVHQFFVNYPNMSVFENIASPLRVAGVGEGEIRRRVGEIADLLRLTPFLERRPHELSGGQQQRTALARAIVKDADIVLLDEPLANLDYKLREELREQLPDLFAHRGAIVVYATTDPADALLLGGHTATMKEGRVTAFGPTGAIYRRPPSLETAEIFSDPPINVAPVEKRGGEVLLGELARWPATGEAAALADGRYTVAVRPHSLRPGEAAADGARLEGRVLITEISGSESVAHFDLAGRVWVAQSRGVHTYAVGEMHTFHLDPAGCLYYDAEGRLVASGAAETQ